ncbi:ProQ/FINO family protein [Marinobacterium sedimentorum]|uniref:ProQ/FINO family protein n=1 Tax=Marinobacterium sedimentorum TaxID=2927804 RepID=UPI0020C6D844|nr:ProQ/FinO family protein [Marinobacterium sedimentorum]MCP8689288.1 ProQ/FinO family protein [Marinobacterium sedimentorum]
MNDNVNAVIEQTEQLLGELDQMLEQREQVRVDTLKQQSESVTVNDVASTENTANTENTKSRSKNRVANQAALKLLMETYPKAFSRTEVRPLKIGIQEDLLADEKIAKNKIKRALASYVRTLSYYRSLQAGNARIDLAGEACGEVSEQEAEHAKGKLKEISRQRREREQQQRKAQAEKEKSDRLSNKLEQLVNLKGR